MTPLHGAITQNRFSVGGRPASNCEKRGPLANGSAKGVQHVLLTCAESYAVRSAVEPSHHQKNSAILYRSDGLFV